MDQWDDSTYRAWMIAADANLYLLLRYCPAAVRPDLADPGRQDGEGLCGRAQAREAEICDITRSSHSE